MICFWTEVTKNATVNATVGYLRWVGGVQRYCRHCARDVRRSVRYSIFVGNIRYSRCSDLASRAKYRSKTRRPLSTIVHVQYEYAVARLPSRDFLALSRTLFFFYVWLEPRTPHGLKVCELSTPDGSDQDFRFIKIANIQLVFVPT